MKKTITPLLCIIIMVIANISAVLAQPGTFYKKHFIQQTFDEIDVLPTGWSVRNSTTTSILGRSGGMALANNTGGKWLSFNGSGSGSRGSELVFPSTSTYSEGYPADSIWNIEFDWTLVTTAASLSPKNAFAIVLSGSNGVVSNNVTTYYLPGILGLYVWKDGGFMHFMNSDRDGLQKRDADGNLIVGETNGVAILAGDYQSWRRATNTDVTKTPVGTADSLNAPSATKVIIALGGTYHITAMIDFKVASQKVLKLIITDVNNPENADTIENKAFLAPTYAGTASTVLPENRIVKDLSMLSTINTRSNQGSNGNSANLAGSGIDNMEVYVWKESIGIADVSVNYLDQSDAAVKASRVVLNQQVGSLFSLVSADKERIVDATNYFAYDANATHLANAAKGTGENLTVDFANNSLAVKFKKSTKTDGNYIWTGANSSTWDELADNFSVNNGPAQSYQTGNVALFTEVSALNKNIVVDGSIDLGASDITVAATGYSYGGIGKLTGTGSFSVLTSTTLGIDNRLEGGVIINTADTIKITNPSAGTSFKAMVDNVKLRLTPGADFSKAITGSGGILNLTAVSNVVYSPAITGVSTVNITLPTVGRETGNSWTNPFTSVFENGTQVNIIDATDQDTVTTYLKYRGATYAINNTSLSVAKVHLGDNTRIILNSTPADNATTSISIGELSGTSKSTIQGNCVSSNYTRILEYAIGGLNTDATFDGSIIPQLTREPARRSGTEKVWTRLTTPGDTVWFIPSTLKIKKVGTGKWTLGGKIIIPDELSPSTITVSAGTLELKDSIVTSAVNIMALTVDPLSTLKANGNFIGMYNININGILEDGLMAGANLTINKTATVKLGVVNFTDNFEKVEAAGDFKADSANLEITVTATSLTKGNKIALFTSSNSDIRFRTITVNGDVIVSDGIAIAGKDYVWVSDEGVFTGELLYDGVSGTKNIYAGKEIRDVKYFDISGRSVKEPVEKSIIIKKTTYTDGTIRTEKVFINRK